MLLIAYYGRQTTRKPQVQLWTDGMAEPQLATRQKSERWHQAPPRMTRELPFDGPWGLVWGDELYEPDQSLHHSETLPLIP